MCPGPCTPRRRARPHPTVRAGFTVPARWPRDRQHITELPVSEEKGLRSLEKAHPFHHVAGEPAAVNLIP